MQIMRAGTLTVAVLALGALAWAVTQAQQSSPFFHSKAYSYALPSGATQQDKDNFYHNMIFGGSSPTTLSLEEREGEVRGTLTGLIMVGTNERQLTITVLDDSLDVLEARAIVNGQLAATATLSNGGIVVRNGLALATMSVLVPPAGTNHTIEVQWDPTSGITNSRSVTGFD